jgi:Flp pilus assembly secretin CpaC
MREHVNQSRVSLTVNTDKSSLTISAKPVGVGAAFQPLILAVERIFVGDAMAVEAGGTGKNEK